MKQIKIFAVVMNSKLYLIGKNSSAKFLTTLKVRSSVVL